MKKDKCTEIRTNGYYKGTSLATIEKISSARICKQICDNTKTCLGWSHSSSSETCWQQSSVDEWVTDTKYKGGSCACKFYSFL